LLCKKIGFSILGVVDNKGLLQVQDMKMHSVDFGEAQREWKAMV